MKSKGKNVKNKRKNRKYYEQRREKIEENSKIIKYKKCIKRGYQVKNQTYKSKEGCC